MGHQYRHYAVRPVTLDRDRTYEQRVDHKPGGIWLSVLGEDDWPTWCRAEEYALDRLGVEHEVALRDDARIRLVAGEDEIDAFHDEYSANLPGDWNRDRRREFRYIDWARVAGEFDGIVIAPYVWSRRLFGPSWYYSWDVASGCIWNLDAIASVKALELSDDAANGGAS